MDEREDRSGMARVLKAVFLLALVGVLAGFGGAVHPAGDSLAVLRVQMTLVLALVSLAMLVWYWRWAVLGLALCALSAATVLGPFGAGGATAAADLTLYQKNLSFRMRDTRALVADMRLMGADVVTLQEVSEPLKAILVDLGDAYPHHAFCPLYSAIGGVAVLSRAPIQKTLCIERSGMVAAYVTPTGRAPHWVVSVHSHWPWPYRQAERLAVILPALATLDGPVVLGGDFNMVPWGHAMQRIRHETDTRRTRGPWSTFTRFHPWAPLPIDQVLSPNGGTASLRAGLGSDHLGLFARVKL